MHDLATIIRNNNKATAEAKAKARKIEREAAREGKKLRQQKDTKR